MVRTFPDSTSVSRTWTRTSPSRRSGSSIVPSQNDRLRTRSRYSRRITIISLCLGRVPSHLLDEDVVQRGLHDLEATHRYPLHRGAQQRLGVGPVLQPDLPVSPVIVHPRHA